MSTLSCDFDERIVTSAKSHCTRAANTIGEMSHLQILNAPRKARVTERLGATINVASTDGSSLARQSGFSFANKAMLAGRPPIVLTPRICIDAVAAAAIETAFTPALDGQSGVVPTAVYVLQQLGLPEEVTSPVACGLVRMSPAVAVQQPGIDSGAQMTA